MQVFLKSKSVRARFVPTRLGSLFLSAFIILSLFGNTAFGSLCPDLIAPNIKTDRNVQKSLIQISGLLGARHHSYIRDDGKLVHIVIDLDNRKLGPQSAADLGEIARAVAIKSINLEPIHPSIQPVEISEDRKNFVRGELENAQKIRDEKVKMAKNDLNRGFKSFIGKVAFSLLGISAGVYLINAPDLDGLIAAFGAASSFFVSALQIYMGKEILSLDLQLFRLKKDVAEFEYAVIVLKNHDEELFRSAGFENSHQAIYVVPADLHAAVAARLSTSGFKDAVYDVDSRTFVPVTDQP